MSQSGNLTLKSACCYRTDHITIPIKSQNRVGDDVLNLVFHSCGIGSYADESSQCFDPIQWVPMFRVLISVFGSRQSYLHLEHDIRKVSFIYDVRCQNMRQAVHPSIYAINKVSVPIICKSYTHQIHCTYDKQCQNGQCRQRACGTRLPFILLLQLNRNKK